MKTLTLKTPVRGAKSMVGELRFREPRFDDFMSLGDPRVPVISGDRFVMQPVPQLIRDYAERLLVVEGDVNINIMASVGLKDAQAIQETVLGFFSESDPPTSSGASPESSSSSPSETSPASAP